IAELRDRILITEQAIRAAKSDFDQKRNELNASIEEIREHRLEASNLDYTIVAPAAGRVTNLQAKPGRFEDGHLPLMSIVRDQDRLVATLYVPTRAAGFVRNGQKVKLRVDAFPFEKFGT